MPIPPAVLNDAACLALLEPLAALIRTAGERVMAVYAQPFEVNLKGDASPVTLADQLAEALILEGLARLAPGIPVVAEEAAAAGQIPDVSACFFLVDPLDGTREFISRNGEFTVNIALIRHGLPVMGLVLAPAKGPVPTQPASTPRPGLSSAPSVLTGPGRLYVGLAGDTPAAESTAWVEDAQGRRPLRTRPVPDEGLTVVASRSHGDAAALDAFLAHRQVAALAQAGSSLKLCLLAAGEADVYPRFGRTMEWDIAAGHAVLRAAGGHVNRLDAGQDSGQVLGYGKPGFENPHFVAWGR